AIRDIVAYHNAGTLVRAFTQLSKDTAARANQSEKKVLELQDINHFDVVVLTPNITAAALMISNHLIDYAKIFRVGTDEDKKKVSEKLRRIYRDIVKGGNSEMFWPVLEDIKQKKPSLNPDMDRLEAETGSESVSGETTLKILSSIFSAVDLQKQDLVITLKEIFENRM